MLVPLLMGVLAFYFSQVMCPGTSKKDVLRTKEIYSAAPVSVAAETIWYPAVNRSTDSEEKVYDWIARAHLDKHGAPTGVNDGKGAAGSGANGAYTAGHRAATECFRFNSGLDAGFDADGRVQFGGWFADGGAADGGAADGGDVEDNFGFDAGRKSTIGARIGAVADNFGFSTGSHAGLDAGRGFAGGDTTVVSRTFEETLGFTSDGGIVLTQEDGLAKAEPPNGFKKAADKYSSKTTAAIGHPTSTTREYDSDTVPNGALVEMLTGRGQTKLVPLTEIARPFVARNRAEPTVLQNAGGGARDGGNAEGAADGSAPHEPGTATIATFTVVTYTNVLMLRPVNVAMHDDRATESTTEGKKMSTNMLIGTLNVNQAGVETFGETAYVGTSPTASLHMVFDKLHDSRIHKALTSTRAEDENKQPRQTRALAALRTIHVQDGEQPHQPSASPQYQGRFEGGPARGDGGTHRRGRSQKTSTAAYGKRAIGFDMKHGALKASLEVDLTGSNEV